MARHNPLELRLRGSWPTGATTDEVLRAALVEARGGRAPGEFDLEIEWRNPETKSGRTKDWQAAPLGKAIAASSQGFKNAVIAGLQEMLEEEFEEEEFEEEEAEEFEERPAPPPPRHPRPKPEPEAKPVRKRSEAAKKGAETKRRKKEEEERKRQQRSEAAKKAAETRRRNQAAAERKARAEHKRRAEAAQRGWETRRANARKRARALAKTKGAKKKKR